MSSLVVSSVDYEYCQCIFAISLLSPLGKECDWSSGSGREVNVKSLQTDERRTTSDQKSPLEHSAKVSLKI